MFSYPWGGSSYFKTEIGANLKKNNLVFISLVLLEQLAMHLNFIHVKLKLSLFQVKLGSRPSVKGLQSSFL